MGKKKGGSRRKSKAPIVRTGLKIFFFADGTYRAATAISENRKTQAANIPVKDVSSAIRAGIYVVSGFDIKNKSGARDQGSQGALIGVAEAVGGPMGVDEVHKLAPASLKRMKVRRHPVL